ncbi:MAG: hypothetical protein FWD60_12725 [Candidatus Azobacteroides sp.]|nr:hypothetical protein [Candidatus Azobacteroides sp.]
MKWNNIKLNEIRKDAKESLKYKDFNANSKTKVYLLYLYVLPILFALVLLSLGLFIEKEIASYFITSISIFAGLFFSLLFIVTDKYKEKKDNLKDTIIIAKEDNHNEYDITVKENDDSEVCNYLKRYKNFSIFLVRQISFTIVLAVVLILSLSIIYFSPLFPQMDSLLWKYVRLAAKYLLNGIIYYWIAQFIVFLIVILSNMYVMLLDDINFEKGK